jgi:polyribonucleotide nucleotidyltransferase
MGKKVACKIYYVDISQTVISIDPKCETGTSALVNAQSPWIQSLLPIKPPVVKAVRDGYKGTNKRVTYPR